MAKNKKRLKELQDYNQLKNIENIVLENYLLKMDPTLFDIVDGQVQVLDKSDVQSKSTTSISKLMSTSLSQTHVLSQITIRSSLPKLQNEFKLNLVDQAIASEEEKCKKYMDKCEKEKHLHATKMREIEIRKKDIDISKTLLEQFVHSYKIPITKKIAGEKLIAFMKNNIKQTEYKIEKHYLLKLKFNKHLKEINERVRENILRPELKNQIDYDYVRIVNNQLLNAVDKKTKSLSIKRKEFALIEGSIRSYKHFVQKQNLQVKLIKEKTHETQLRIEKLKEHQHLVNMQIVRAGKSYFDILNWKNRLPSNKNYITEYAKKRDELKQLQLRIQQGKRRLQVQTSKMLILRKQLLKPKYNNHQLVSNVTLKSRKINYY